MPTTEVRVEGLKRLQQLLTGTTLYAEPWRREMTALASRSGLGAQRAAPVYQGIKKRNGPAPGLLQRKTYARMQKRPIPLWIAVRVRARRKGYPYGVLLEYSRKHGHFGWLSNAVKQLWSGAGQTLNAIAHGIEQNWSKG